MPRYETDHALGCPVVARELGTAARVIEITRERRVPRSETRAHSRREPLKQNAPDAMPEQRPGWLRSVVEHASDDDLLIGSKIAQDPGGRARVAIVGARRTEIAHGLLHSVEHS